LIILPAIDIKDGRAVRLRRGDFSTVHKVAENPLLTAMLFRDAGCAWVHMVDLDGALQKKPVNTNVFLDIAAQSGLKTELGGGIQSLADIEFYLQNGIDRLILGSAAIRQPALVREAVLRFGAAHIAVGIDAKDGYAAAVGWLAVSDVRTAELARRMEDAGVETLVFTDISRDGMLTGPNLQELAALQAAVKCKIIASGGIKDAADIRALKTAGLYGAIAGKSIYAGTLDLEAALRAANGEKEEEEPHDRV
jgi:phosphoribosylformimino-5-aminoimidazole carboxamide ribotide isomerase